MVTIETYDNVSEAYIAKGLLESHGIKCLIKNEYISQILPPLGAIELQVAEEDLEEARRILANAQD